MEFAVTDAISMELLPLNNAQFSWSTTNSWIANNDTNQSTQKAFDSIGALSVRQCRMLSQFIILTIGGGALCLLGLAGNALSLVALHRDSISPVASLLLQSLACVDSIFILLWFWLFSVRSALRFFGANLSAPTLYPYIELYAFPLLFVLQSATVWLTVTIAVTRYIAICLPFVANRIVTLNSIRVTVIGVVIGSVIYNLPRFFATYIEVVEKDGRARVNFNTTQLGSSYFYSKVYSDIMYYIFSFGLPLAILLILNSRLILCYRVIRRKRHTILLRNGAITGGSSPHQQLQKLQHYDAAGSGNSSAEEGNGGMADTIMSQHNSTNNIAMVSNNGGCHVTEEINITLIMITVIIVFILCTAPARLVQIIWGYNPASCPQAAFFVTEISNVLEVLNSSANFLVYISVRPAFRIIVANIFCKKSQRAVANCDGSARRENSKRWQHQHASPSSHLPTKSGKRLINQEIIMPLTTLTTPVKNTDTECSVPMIGALI